MGKKKRYESKDFYWADKWLIGTDLEFIKMPWLDYDYEHGIKRRTSLTPLADDRN